MGLPTDTRVEQSPRKKSNTIPLDDMDQCPSGEKEMNEGVMNNCSIPKGRINLVKLGRSESIDQETTKEETYWTNTPISSQYPRRTVSEPLPKHRTTQPTTNLGDNLNCYVHVDVPSMSVMPTEDCGKEHGEGDKLLCIRCQDTRSGSGYQIHPKENGASETIKGKFEDDIEKGGKTTRKRSSCWCRRHCCCCLRVVLSVAVIGAIVGALIYIPPKIRTEVAQQLSKFMEAQTGPQKPTTVGTSGSNLPPVKICPSSVYSLSTPAIKAKTNEDFLGFEAITESLFVKYSDTTFTFQGPGQYLIDVDFHLSTLTTQEKVDSMVPRRDELCLWFSNKDSLCKKVSLDIGMVKPIGIHEVITVGQGQVVTLKFTVIDKNILYLGPRQNMLKIHPLRC